MSRNNALNHLVPIPTYEEAISRPSSSQRSLGPTETSHDAQRQHLLPNDGYRPSTVESVRNSMDSDLTIPEMVRDGQHDHLELEELDYLDPGQSETVDRRQARRYHRARIRSKIAQQLSSLSATLGALRLPSFRRSYTTVPSPTDDAANPEPTMTWRSRFSRSLHIPEQYRMSIPTFARLCALLTIVGLVWFLFTLNFFPRRNLMALTFEPESVREFVQDQVDGTRIRGWLDHLSSFAHEAGSRGDYYLANWLSSQWREACVFDGQALLEYDIMANYPTKLGRYVRATISSEETWEATLEEDIQDEMREQTLPWHAYSANGVAKGPLLYANRGSRADYQYLHDNNITTEGAIALIHIDMFDELQNAGLKIRFAQEAGCAGVLIANGDILHKLSIGDKSSSLLPGNDSMHRVNAVPPNWILGDPLTPGWSSSKGARKDHEAAANFLPTIPSLPLSWRDAVFLLEKLDGRGRKQPGGWLAWSAYTGAGTENPTQAFIVEMQNSNDVADAQTIWQPWARMEGTESPQMRVVVGAPRDSWCFGASRSASASAVLTEVIAVFGQLRKQGWRPLRSIEFISWDANTFNAAGSTEYVEDQVDALRDSGVAYVNIPSAASGLDYRATGSPMLQQVLLRALNRVVAPGTNQTMKEVYDMKTPSHVNPLPPITGLTDSVPFTHIAGIPSLDMGFIGEQGRWVRGSCYDTFKWLQNAVDSTEDLVIHKALAQVWALVILELASSPLIPLDARTYADHLATDVDELEASVLKLVASQAHGQDSKDLDLDLTPLHDAVASLRDASEKFHAFEDHWTGAVQAQGGMEDIYQNRQRHGWNGQIVQFEKALIDRQKHKEDGTPGGLKDRPQFRHILLAPRKWEDGVQAFPTIWDYLNDQEWKQAGEEVSRIAAMIEAAAEPLGDGR